jgi:hypothetical protein
MMIGKIALRMKASHKTIEDMVSKVDVAAITSSAIDGVEVVPLNMDEPVVNGVNLYNHRYQSNFFKDVKKKGGVIAVIRKEGKDIEILHHTDSGDVAQNVSEFSPQFERYKESASVAAVSVALKGNFHLKRGRAYFPKAASPEDFWLLFSETERNTVFASSDERIIKFVSETNARKNVSLKSKEIKEGVSLLYTSGVISKRTYQEVSDAD